MIAGIQLLAILFGIIMIYWSFVYYKRKDYTWRSFLIWTTVWLAFMVLVMYPKTLYSLMQALEIQRTADFFVMVGFGLFAVIIFYMYVTVKKTESKVQRLVRTLAFERQEKKKTVVKKKSAKKKTTKR